MRLKKRSASTAAQEQEAPPVDGTTTDVTATNGEVTNGDQPVGDGATVQPPVADGEVSGGEVDAAPAPPTPEVQPEMTQPATTQPETAQPAMTQAEAVPPQGTDEDRLPVGFWVDSLLDTGKPPPREELDRQAELDFQAAISPSLQGLREAVPDASSPEEAMRALEERLGEPVPDPEAGKGFAKDIYNDDTAVYYRIRAHFEKPKRRVGWQRSQPWQPPQGLASRGR